VFSQTKTTKIKGAFRVKKNISKKLAKRKRKIEKRTEKKNYDNQRKPIMTGGNICYDIDGRHQGIAYGGIGNIHQLAKHSGLIDEIDKRIELLKRHLPYHESDHILNIAYNYLVGGSCLQDIDLLRNDEAWLNALNAEIIPDPTTAGDFLRRFKEEDICAFMDVKNTVRSNIWQQQPTSFRKEAIINMDGTITGTTGQCKQGMDIAYNGIWGYHPLIISLHNSREPLYIVNRPANAPSHLDSAQWVDKSLDLVGPHFKKVQLRGDTDFSLTEHFDKWDQRCTFIFGMDAMPNLVKIANKLNASDWSPLKKRPEYQVKTYRRRKPKNVKQQIVKERKYKKITTCAEDIAEIEYRPGKCKKAYRLIILRKTLEVVKGEMNLFDDIRYFFYITNDWKRSKHQMLHFYRNRSDHENDIDQLKNGVKALAPASDSLLSNWALMTIASLAWDLKAWYGMLLPYRPLGLSIIRMEYKRFLNTFIRIPCLIIRTGRRIYYRLVGYNDKIKHVINFSESIKAMGVT
jgi:hypothetical protein